MATPATFPAWYGAFLRRPSRSAAALTTEPHALRLGSLAMAVPVVGYVLVYVGLARGGAYPSTFDPWLAVPAERYYDTNVWLLAPSMIAGWILAAGVAQLLARRLGGLGSFEQTFAVLGFAISLAHWSLLPHDLLVAGLGASGVIDAVAHEHAMNEPTLARTILWAFMIVYALVFPTLFAAVLAGAHRLGRARAAVVGLCAFAVYQLVFVLFNR